MTVVAPGSPVLFDHPNPRANAFIMMRFQESAQHQSILSALRDALKHYGVSGLRADEQSYADLLWANVKSYMDACAFGVVVFEQLGEQEFNPSVSIELGYMMAQGKPVLLLKQSQMKALPTDIVGHLYKSFDPFDIPGSIPQRVREWLRDIGIAKSPAEKLVLFVSKAGTCRCAMAKVALQQALVERQLPYRMRVMSVANKFGDVNRASRNARRVVFEAYGSALLEEHRVTRTSLGLVEDADLILVMDQGPVDKFPSGKTFGFNSFFGLPGDVPNPWPDDQDDKAMQRYRDCLLHLRNAIEGGLEKVLECLERDA